MLSSQPVRGILGRLVVAGLLTLCVVICALEFSGRWDQTLHDANDEVAILAVVLCVGVAIAGANVILKRFAATTTWRFIVFAAAPCLKLADLSDSWRITVGSPPLLPLRI